MSGRAQTRSSSRKIPTQPSVQSQAITSTIPFRSRKIRKIASDSSVKGPSRCSLKSDTKAPRFKIAGLDETLILTKPDEEAETLAENSTRLLDVTSAVITAPLIKPLSTDGEIECSLQHLRDSDPLLRSVIDAFQPPSFDSSRSPFHALTKSIIYQQLSTKAGKCIYTRFISLFETEANINSKTILSLSAQQLREIGISGRKASYMHDLACKYEDGSLSDEMILRMDDERLLKKLTTVKGIGPWTVHMFMIFSLHRPDVLPVGDLGVRKGVKMLYKLNGLPDAVMMEKMCEKWKPYRSVGSWYMWRFVEAKGVLAPPLS
uniref:HhH-GPD domain-containing protein n=1 Tax=Kalanchoe fedtschenkoi TaxID=63787 RepID=A0A7N0T8C8_KALFE